MSGGRRLTLVASIVLFGCRPAGHHQDAGEVTRKRVPEAVIAERSARQATSARAVDGAQKQILFGDLHVHTTFSADAFIASLPMLQGEGAHPPADACDFARFCSSLDFWSINDHAESITPDHWRETKEAIRQCNAVAGDPKNPDVVAFLGWEWTQVGRTPKDHYGHKNVILRETAEDRVPKRPISALSPQLVGALRNPPPFWQRIQFPLNDWANRQRYFDFEHFQKEMRAVPLCPAGVDTRELPADCHEKADTPQELFEKLAQWGFEAIVIPHGTTWGLYTPPGTTFDKQLAAAQQPQRQQLFEVYSGHGNSEEFRNWKSVEWDASGDASGKGVCPAATKDYEPCCWRAGEIIRSRCADAPADECEQRVSEARQNYVDAGVLGRQTVPGTSVEDWKDCGQCRDCFAPAYNMQPGNSAQYALAIRNFDDPAHPQGFVFGFMASSDNHSARPGTGYKEFSRHGMTEAVGTRDPSWRARVLGPEAPPSPRSVPFDPNAPRRLQAFQLLDVERQASFFMTGGLVAVHAEGRDRDSVWHALERREVYGTSGDRILLWFDLLNGAGGPLPMGSETRLGETPRFRVRAVGALVQKPGCAESSIQALSPERLQRLCHGECYNPGDERRRITRVEVVRIRPQRAPGEPVASLIEDPWKRIACPADPAGCSVDFEDADFVGAGRETIYYVRAIEEPSPAVNAGGVRCKYNAAGECIEAHPCFGDYRTPFTDDCLSPNEERAWSSPIYVSR
jgi:hypothetical protein